MFETKVVKSRSSFTKYLDQYRCYLALKGLDPEQYANFQNKTLDVLVEVQKNLDKIKEYVELHRNKTFIKNIDSFKRYILSLFMESLHIIPSNYILDVCDELIEDIDDNSIDCDSSLQYSIMDGKMEAIFEKNKQLIERFIRKSFNKDELAAEIYPKEDSQTTKEKLKVYEELTSKTLNFSDSTIFKNLASNPQFLMNFYSNYTKKNCEYSSSSDSQEIDTIVNEIKSKIEKESEISHSSSLLFELDICIKELEEFDGIFNRIIKRAKLKDFYRKLDILINRFYDTIFSISDNDNEFIYGFRKALKNGSYRKIYNYMYHLKDMTENYILKEKKYIMNQFIILKSTDNPFLELIYSNSYLGNNELFKSYFNECYLMNLFYESYKGLSSTSLSDEELIYSIRNNRYIVMEFVSSLIDVIEKEESLKENVEENTKGIAEYYDTMQSGPELTEQEVIDFAIKHLSLTC